MLSGRLVTLACQISSAFCFVELENCSATTDDTASKAMEEAFTKRFNVIPSEDCGTTRKSWVFSFAVECVTRLTAD